MLSIISLPLLQRLARIFNKLQYEQSRDTGRRDEYYIYPPSYYLIFPRRSKGFMPGFYVGGLVSKKKPYHCTLAQIADANIKIGTLSIILIDKETDFFSTIYWFFPYITIFLFVLQTHASSLAK